MAYVEHEWVNGETITAEKMNNIEEGIAQSGGGFDVEIQSSTCYIYTSTVYSVIKGDYNSALEKISNGEKLEILLWGCGESYGLMMYQRAVAQYVRTMENDAGIEILFYGYDWYEDAPIFATLEWTANGITRN